MEFSLAGSGPAHLVFFFRERVPARTLVPGHDTGGGGAGGGGWVRSERGQDGGASEGAPRTTLLVSTSIHLEVQCFDKPARVVNGGESYGRASSTTQCKHMPVCVPYGREGASLYETSWSI